MGISELVNRYTSEIIQLTQDLVRIPSENRAPYGDEEQAQLFLVNWFHKNGIETDYFNLSDVIGLKEHEAYWPGREYKQRPNVVAKLSGTGGGKSLIFSSHIDTVTRNPLPWHIASPFSGKIEGDRLYGRGSYDMKAGLAVTAVIMKLIHDEGLVHSGDIYFESVVDEENAGANGTLASRIKGYNPDFAIIPEPTNLKICNQCKGGQVFEISFTGISGVKYAEDGIVNPIYSLAKVVQRIGELEQYINRDITDETQRRNVVLSKVCAGDLSPGGNIGNPSSAWLEMFIQVNAGSSEDMLRKEIDDFLNPLIKSDPALCNYKPTISRSSRFLYPSVTMPEHPGVLSLLQSEYAITGQKAQANPALFACDSFIFKELYNIDTALVGPMGGNAHGQDEWVSISSLTHLAKMLLGATLDYCK